MFKHILGFPRMGAQRELKFALESFWKGKSSLDDLQAVSRSLRLRHWQIQKDAGLSAVAVGDFSWYDHMLDTALMLGAVPARFRHLDPAAPETCFALARGDQAANIPAMEMTKWFNTNYHYIVPEIDASFAPALASRKLFDELDEAIAAGFSPKPVLVGPFTFLALSKGVDGFDPWQKLDAVLAAYEKILAALAPKCEWLQLDEPILVSALPAAARDAFPSAYARLVAAAAPAKVILATYFDALDENLDLAVSSGCAALHVDLVRGGFALDAVLAALPASMALSAGVVEGRNIWRNDFDASLAVLRKISAALGPDRLMVASSCSLLHSPVSLDAETALDPEIKSWLAFATEKCSEVATLAAALAGDPAADAALAANRAAIASRRASPRVHNPDVAARAAAVTPDMERRASPFPVRRAAQAWMNLPEFPTTTIGSYPQTPEIRRTRLAFRKGELSRDAYVAAMRAEIKKVVDAQEELGLDVLVHGEPERNDMVEYFGQQLSGFCFTANGWVQSYGSRCVKPPVIFGDVSRPAPMTLDWITYAQSLTKKPMKGMLTGPVTILCWSFVRDDLPREAVCRQIALAIRDEVADLEKAGIRVIQIDEAALSEGLPVKPSAHAAYLDWAVACFRLATSCVADPTQIHTHMCYSEFNKIIRGIAAMDADVISIEASRSKMELLDAFRTYEYPNGIGPGVYDIHSPRIPTTEEIVGLLRKAAEYIPRDRLWVNPDCGLKTRDWPEVLPSLRHMVEAAKILREG